MVVSLKIISFLFIFCVTSTVTENDYRIVYVEKGVYSYEKTAQYRQIGQCITLQALVFFGGENPPIRVTWKKDMQPIPTNDRVSNSSTSLTIRALRPSDHAYYQATVEHLSINMVERTEFWLHVKGCGKHQRQLQHSSSTSCQNLCEDKCPQEWTYVDGTSSKCCQYFSTPQPWIIASENCQAIGGELTTINNDIENKFISNMLKTAAGGWIGLNDRETEGKYVWNFQQSASQIPHTWGVGEPNNNNGGCNIENCVSMNSNGKWTDVVCGAFNSFVCQVNTAYNGSDVEEWSCLGSTCYKYFPDNLQWQDAVSRCSSIHETGRLVTITSSGINNIVRSFSTDSIWIGLNDIREAGAYQWVGSTSKFSYSNWEFAEPNDLFYHPDQPSCPGEDCVQIKKFGGNISWSDLGCDTKLPYICERIRDRAFSTGAYVGMVIGSFVLLSMIFGILHAAFQRHKRTAVKDIIKAAYKEDIKMRDDKNSKIPLPRLEKLSFRSAARLFIPNRYEEF